MTDNMLISIPEDVDGDEYIIQWRFMVDSGELEWCLKYGTERITIQESIRHENVC